MKKLAVVLIAIGGVLSGCVAYEPVHHRGGYEYRGDRDRDGVRNRNDRRPNDPYRY